MLGHTSSSYVSKTTTLFVLPSTYALCKLASPEHNRKSYINVGSNLHTNLDIAILIVFLHSLKVYDTILHTSRGVAQVGRALGSGLRGSRVQVSPPRPIVFTVKLPPNFETS
jgi:hypothetical protein